MAHAKTLRTLGIDLPQEVIDSVKQTALARRMTVKAYAVWCFELGIETHRKEEKSNKRKKKGKVLKGKGKPKTDAQNVQDDPKSIDS